jgi:hypothetical protein
MLRIPSTLASVSTSNPFHSSFPFLATLPLRIMKIGIGAISLGDHVGAAKDSSLGAGKISGADVANHSGGDNLDLARAARR